MNLGSVYDSDDKRPRGRDLHATVSLRRSQLGRPVTVVVPLQLPLDGERVSRAVGPGETGPELQLNLPVDLPETARLRMRGLGETSATHAPGDLYLTVEIVDGPALSRTGALFTLGSLALAAVVAFFLLK